MSTLRPRLLVALLALVSPLVGFGAQSPDRASTGSIAGIATIDGAPAEGLTIVVVLNELQPQPRETTTGADGRYRFDGVPPGSHVVMAMACGLIRVGGPHAGSLSESADVTAGGVAEPLELGFTRGGVVAGRIVDSVGAGVARECVAAIPVDAAGRRQLEDGEELLFGGTSRDGTYTLCGLPPGRYVIRAGCTRAGLATGAASLQPRYAPGVISAADATIVEVAAGRSVAGVDVALGAPSSGLHALVGRVVDGMSGEPVAGVTLRLGVTDGGGGMSHDVGESGPDGAFRVPSLKPGTYLLALGTRGETASRYVARPLEVKVGDVDAEVVLRLERAATISGVVVVENGGDAASTAALAHQRVRPAVVPSLGPGISIWTEFAPVGQDGRFRLGGLPAGRHQVTLAEGNRAFWVRRVEIGSGDATEGISVAPGEEVANVRIVVAYGRSSIHGRIEGRDGAPVPAGVIVAVIPRPAVNMAFAPGLAADVDASGTFVIRGLIPGEYELTAHVPSPDGRFTPGTREPVRVVVGDTAVDVVVVVDGTAP